MNRYTVKIPRKPFQFSFDKHVKEPITIIFFENWYLFHKVISLQDKNLEQR